MKFGVTEISITWVNWIKEELEPVPQGLVTQILSFVWEFPINTRVFHVAAQCAAKLIEGSMFCVLVI